MQGTLLFVTGYSGAGKTTLVDATLKELPDLHYLTTVTTRKPRNDEEKQSYEYEFVSSAEYEHRRSLSDQWDHTEYAGNSYGADVEYVNKLLSDGQSVICNVAPDPKIIADMAQHYRVKPVVLWIDTPLPTANARIAADPSRVDRNNDEPDDKALSVKHNADAVFTPANDLAKDIKTFVALVTQLNTKDT